MRFFFVLLVCLIACLQPLAASAQDPAEGSAPLTTFNFSPEPLTEPAPTAAPGGVSVIKSLDKQAIRTIILAAKPALRACVASQKPSPGFTLKFTVQPSGEVSSAEVDLPDHPDVAACLSTALKALRFPESGMVTVVEYPIR